LGFGVQGSRFGVRGLGLEVQGLGWVLGMGFRDWGLDILEIKGQKAGAKGSRFRASREGSTTVVYTVVSRNSVV